MTTITVSNVLTTRFTPPATCTTLWTYEAAGYNSISRGLLIQNALDVQPDTDCYPLGFLGIGRAPSTQIFSPGACPLGYKTAGNTYNGPTTTAVCCPKYAQA